MKKLVYVFGAVLCLELYSIVPDSLETYALYPFYPAQKVTIQVWVDYAATRIGVLTLIYCIYDTAKKYKFQLFLSWVLVCGYLIDYFMRYNMPKIGTFFSYTTFMVLCFGAILIKTIIDE